MIVLDEQIEISVPREREVKLKSQIIQPTIHEETGRRIYVWRRSNLESQSAEKEKEVQRYDAIRGLLPPPDILISSFRTWEEVGRWYEGLQQEKIQPSPEVRAKAVELTKGLSDDDAKLRAIYNYVSLRYRYVAISFGIGRYQPHAAAEILENQYGDCKDKHTLLAALLSGVGIRAYPALINTRMVVDVDVPSPGQFDHVISVVAKGKLMDGCRQCGPFNASSRGPETGLGEITPRKSAWRSESGIGAGQVSLDAEAFIVPDRLISPKPTFVPQVSGGLTSRS
jgi:hypothetical protein